MHLYIHICMLYTRNLLRGSSSAAVFLCDIVVPPFSGSRPVPCPSASVAGVSQTSCNTKAAAAIAPLPELCFFWPGKFRGYPDSNARAWP